MTFHVSRVFSPVFFLVLIAAHAARADSPSPTRILTVTGIGEVKAAPDSAQLSTGIVTQAPSAAAALAANSHTMNAVFDTLRRAGIADRSIQTSDFSVVPQYAADKQGQNKPRRITGYQVSNTVNVTIDKLDKVGPTLDALVASGANEIEGPDFSIADPKPLLTKAREAAAKDAIDRAETYAKAAGVVLGPIVSINEGGTSEPEPMSRTMMMSAKAAPTPIAEGEESASASVSITWEIR